MINFKNINIKNTIKVLFMCFFTTACGKKNPSTDHHSPISEREQVEDDGLIIEEREREYTREEIKDILRDDAMTNIAKLEKITGIRKKNPEGCVCEEKNCKYVPCKYTAIIGIIIDKLRNNTTTEPLVIDIHIYKYMEIKTDSVFCPYFIKFMNKLHNLFGNWSVKFITTHRFKFTLDMIKDLLNANFIECTVEYYRTDLKNLRKDLQDIRSIASKNKNINFEDNIPYDICISVYLNYLIKGEDIPVKLFSASSNRPSSKWTSNPRDPFILYPTYYIVLLDLFDHLNELNPEDISDNIKESIRKFQSKNFKEANLIIIKENTKLNSDKEETNLERYENAKRYYNELEKAVDDFLTKHT